MERDSHRRGPQEDSHIRHIFLPEADTQAKEQTNQRRDDHKVSNYYKNVILLFFNQIHSCFKTYFADFLPKAPLSAATTVLENGPETSTFSRRISSLFR